MSFLKQGVLATVLGALLVMPSNLNALTVVDKVNDLNSGKTLLKALITKPPKDMCAKAKIGKVMPRSFPAQICRRAIINYYLLARCYRVGDFNTSACGKEAMEMITPNMPNPVRSGEIAFVQEMRSRNDRKELCELTPDPAMKTLMDRACQRKPVVMNR